MAFSGGDGGGGSDVEAGFAKLQGEDFEYYMQTYSIVLGRNSKKSTVDVDLSSLGGGMNISRNHARIFYDFQRRRFALEVLGKNGCLVEGVLHLPGNPPVKLDSQDLLQIGDKEFYFLLPVRSILGPVVPPRRGIYAPPPQSHPGRATSPQPGGRVAGGMHPYVGGGSKKASMRSYYDDDYEDEDGGVGGGSGVGRVSGGEIAAASGGRKKIRRRSGDAGLGGSSVKKTDGRSRADPDADNLQLLRLEENGLVSSVATVLSDLCGPGEWMPMDSLHAELMEQFGNVWHHNRVRRYLTSEDRAIPESRGKPWYGLLTLLRKYPEHFVINTRSKGHMTSEFVSLVSLLS